MWQKSRLERKNNNIKGTLSFYQVEHLSVENFSTCKSLERKYSHFFRNVSSYVFRHLAKIWTNVDPVKLNYMHTWPYKLNVLNDSTNFTLFRVLLIMLTVFLH